MDKIVKSNKKGIEGLFAQIILYTYITLIFIFLLIPIVITIMYSLKAPDEHLLSIWTLPATPQWFYYRDAFSQVGKNMLNSIIVCTASTVGVIFFGSITAYVFSRHDFWGKELLFALILALMMIPNSLLLTPTFLVVNDLGLLDTMWALILPNMAGPQVGAIFLFRTFFSQQPKAIFESAKIDGAGDFRMYFSMTLPLAVPVLIIQALGTFGALYNDYLWPMLVIKDNSVQTLMPMLKTISEKVSLTDPGISYAMYIVAGLPLIAISLFGLKYFVSGDFAAGLKL